MVSVDHKSMDLAVIFSSQSHLDLKAEVSFLVLALNSHLEVDEITSASKLPWIVGRIYSVAAETMLPTSSRPVVKSVPIASSLCLQTRLRLSLKG